LFFIRSELLPIWAGNITVGTTILLMSASKRQGERTRLRCRARQFVGRCRDVRDIDYGWFTRWRVRWHLASIAAEILEPRSKVEQLAANTPDASTIFSSSTGKKTTMPLDATPEPIKN
jgi:hypothetical protein